MSSNALPATEMCSVLGSSTRLPDIYFRADGRIDITASVVLALDIREGDSLDIWEDGGERLLYVRNRASSSIGRHKATCRSTKKSHRYMRAWCVELCSYMLACTGGLSEAHLLVGEKTVHPLIGVAVPLITRNNLYEKQ